MPCWPAVLRGGNDDGRISFRWHAVNVRGRRPSESSIHALTSTISFRKGGVHFVSFLLLLNYLLHWVAVETFKMRHDQLLKISIRARPSVLALTLLANSSVLGCDLLTDSDATRYTRSFGIYRRFSHHNGGT